jgi:hypothetical protein
MEKAIFFVAGSTAGRSGPLDIQVHHDELKIEIVDPNESAIKLIAVPQSRALAKTLAGAGAQKLSGIPSENLAEVMNLVTDRLPRGMKSRLAERNVLLAGTNGEPVTLPATWKDAYKAVSDQYKKAPRGWSVDTYLEALPDATKLSLCLGAMVGLYFSTSSLSDYYYLGGELHKVNLGATLHWKPFIVVSLASTALFAAGYSLLHFTYCLTRKALIDTYNFLLLPLYALHLHQKAKNGKWAEMALWLRLHGTKHSRRKLAMETTSPEVLSRLFSSEKVNGRQDYLWSLVAGNRHASPELLAQIASESEEGRFGTFMAIAENPNAPIATLAKLTEYETRKGCSTGVTAKVSHNPKIQELVREAESTVSAEAMRELAANPVFFVRSAVAKNLNAPQELLSVLSKDKACINSVAQNPSAGVEILRDIFRDCSWQQIRISLAGNQAAPDDILSELARATDYTTRMVVARNPKTPVDVLRQLSLDEDKYVREAAAKNPSTIKPPADK